MKLDLENSYKEMERQDKYNEKYQDNQNEEV